MSHGHRGDVEIAEDPGALAERAAELVAAAAQRAVEERGRFLLALSGGTTPKRLYERLTTAPYVESLPWSRTQVFFSDERFVPPDSSESNYHMAREALLSRVPVPDRQVHPVATVGVTPEESAANYEEGMRRVFEVGLDAIPRFDLILLGLGPDGHTASLFPDTRALTVRDRLVAANYVPKLDTWRITFTYPLLEAAHRVLLLAEKEGKAAMLAEILGGHSDLPAARLAVSPGKLTWLVDKEAASCLPDHLQR